MQGVKQDIKQYSHMFSPENAHRNNAHENNDDDDDDNYNDNDNDDGDDHDDHDDYNENDKGIKRRNCTQVISILHHETEATEISKTT